MNKYWNRSIVSREKKYIQAKTHLLATSDSKINTFNMNIIHLPHSSAILIKFKMQILHVPNCITIEYSKRSIFILCVIFGFCIFINMIIITYDGFCASILSISDNYLFFLLLVIHISNIGSLCNITDRKQCAGVHITMHHYLHL